jgi:hypothetical protein
VVNIDNLIHRISPLVEPLHDAFGHARHQIEKLGIATGDDKQWLRTAHYRSEVFDYLRSHPVDDWSLSRKTHHQNGTVHLSHADADLKLRVLREAPIPGGVPRAGQSSRRQAYYQNRPYAQLGLWGDSSAVSHNLLTLWDESSDGISLRLVRPVGLGSKRGVPIDLSADLPRSRTDFEKMRFEVLDEELDDTTVNFEDEEGNGGGSA